MVRFSGAVPIGRKQPLKTLDSKHSERPLCVKADVQIAKPRKRAAERLV
jgi:hypothetical protein